MDDVDERDLRLARRLKLGVRLVIYPLLLVLLAVAWHARAALGEKDGAAVVAPPLAHELRGTAPGLAAPAHAFTSGGRLRSLYVQIATRCGDGSSFMLRWTFRGSRLVQRDAAVSDDETAHGRADDGGSMSAVASLRGAFGRGAINVVLSASVVWTRAADGRVLQCEAAPLRVTLRASG